MPTHLKGLCPLVVAASVVVRFHRLNGGVTAYVINLFICLFVCLLLLLLLIVTIVIVDLFGTGDNGAGFFTV